MIFKFCSFGNSLAASFPWAKQKNNAELAPSFLFFSLPFLFAFFFAVVPECTMLCLTFSLLMLVDRGLRSFSRRCFFAGADIELLVKVGIFKLEQRKKTSVPQG